MSTRDTVREISLMDRRVQSARETLTILIKGNDHDEHLEVGVVIDRLKWWLRLSFLLCIPDSRISLLHYAHQLSLVRAIRLHEEVNWIRLLENIAQVDKQLASSLREGCPSQLMTDTFSEAVDSLSKLVELELLSQLYEGLMNLGKQHIAKASGGSFIKLLEDQRRSRGSHYTDVQLCSEVVEGALAPLWKRLDLLEQDERVDALLQLCICDPAMGGGAFIFEVIEQLASRLQQWSNLELDEARSRVAGCVYGVDLDPFAVELTQLRLATLVSDWQGRSKNLIQGDALMGRCFEGKIDKPKDEQLGQSYLKGYSHTLDWDEAFPKVSQLGGFDAIVGNPPFLGGRQMTAVLGRNYVDSLVFMFPDAKRSADLSAFFVRRSYHLLRPQGVLGFITTNTIAQGTTRLSGLGAIVKEGGRLFYAWRRRIWRGDASVRVSLFGVQKEERTEERLTSNRTLLNGREVKRISSFLYEGDLEELPARLTANQSRCFQGVITLGMGFTFSERSEGQGSINELNKLLEERPVCRERIKPYLGGRELNTDPTHRAYRYVIDFEGMELAEAQSWPSLLKIVEERVAPLRLTHRNPAIRKYPWWLYWNRRAGLSEKLKGRERVLLTNAQASAHLCFAFVPAEAIFANSLNIIPDATESEFAILQSRIHEIWAWRFSSTLGDQLRYNPTTCFETFPFPRLTQSAHLELAELGQRYHHLRSALMSDVELRQSLLDGSPPEGLTALYNRFHHPTCDLKGIQELRLLHTQLDRATARAYGWEDLDLACQWVDHYSEQSIEQSQFDRVYAELSEAGRGRKYLWRLTLSPHVRDEILHRLVRLNQQRAHSLGGHKNETIRELKGT